MSLAHFQAALARLLTDETAREEFISSPETTGAAWQLTADEIAQLQQMLPRDVREFANSLHAKRRAEVADWLPHTRRTLGEKYSTLFEGHAAQFLPRGTNKPRDDALAFAAFLQRGEFKNMQLWQRETARFEALNIRATRRRFQIALLHFSWRDLVGENAANAPRKMQFVIWISGKIYSTTRARRK